MMLKTEPVVGIHLHFLEQCFANMFYVLIYAEETSLLKGRFADPLNNPLVFITWNSACEVLTSGTLIQKV